MKVALAQINTTVGDIDGNTQTILDRIARGIAEGADMIVFPELAVFGYPPKDLLLRVSARAASLGRTYARYSKNGNALVA